MDDQTGFSSPLNTIFLKEKSPKDGIDLPDQKYELIITVKNEHEQKELFDELMERCIQCVILQ